MERRFSVAGANFKGRLSCGCNGWVSRITYHDAVPPAGSGAGSGTGGFERRRGAEPHESPLCWPKGEIPSVARLPLIPLPTIRL